MLYGKRLPLGEESATGVTEKHTIAIAFQSLEWVLIDYELIDLGDVCDWFDDESEQYS